MSWTDERTELLKKLWAEGHSASRISARIPGTTRNSVIAKVHRLGLSGRRTTTRLKSQASSNRRVNPNKKVARKPPGNPAFRALYTPDAEPYVPPKDDIVIPVAERKTIEQLEAEHCRWPFGDPKHAEFHFCGKTKLTGLPYCEFHARRAFQPPEPKVRKRPVGSPVVAKRALEHAE